MNDDDDASIDIYASDAIHLNSYTLIHSLTFFLHMWAVFRMIDQLLSVYYSAKNANVKRLKS